MSTPPPPISQPPIGVSGTSSGAPIRGMTTHIEREPRDGAVVAQSSGEPIDGEDGDTSTATVPGPRTPTSKINGTTTSIPNSASTSSTTIPIFSPLSTPSISTSQSSDPMMMASRTRAKSSATISSVTTFDSSVSTLTDGEEGCVTEKRIKEWRKHFAVDEEEELVCTHGCALVSGIMLHGRLYISTKSVGFRSNILGVKTKRHFPLSELKSVTPSYVAGCIPNALLIEYGDSTEEITTLPDRDHTLLLLLRSWKLHSPSSYERFLETTKTAARGDKEEREGARRVLKLLGEFEVDDVKVEGVVEEEVTVMAVSEGEVQGVHPATIADTKELEKVALISKVHATPEESYNLLYHNDDFLKSIWEKQGFRDIDLQPWKDNKRTFSYVKPIGGRFGSVKCISTEEIKHEASEGWYEVEGTTQTPDVPSGKSFQTRSRTVLSHDGKGGTKMHASFQVEWSGSSLLKGMINGQAESGQKEWNKLVAGQMRAYIRDHPDDFHRGDKLVEGEKDDDDDDEGGEAGASTIANHSSTLNDFAARTSEWIQQDAVRGLIAIALALSLSLHFWNYLLSFHACKDIDGHSY